MAGNDALRESTMNNTNLAGPEPRVNGGHNHHNLHDRTHMNENLTAPTPRVGDPLEKDFSQYTSTNNSTTPN